MSNADQDSLLHENAQEVESKWSPADGFLTPFSSKVKELIGL